MASLCHVILSQLQIVSHIQLLFLLLQNLAFIILIVHFWQKTKIFVEVETPTLS